MFKVNKKTNVAVDSSLTPLGDPAKDILDVSFLWSSVEMEWTPNMLALGRPK